MLWTGFSLRLSLYFGALSFSSTLTSPSVPAAEEQLHNMRLIPAHFTFGMVLCMWWVVPGFLQTWCLEVHQTRESCSSQSEGPLGAFWQIPSVFSCVFTEKRIEFGHTAIKHSLVECCSDVWPSVGFSHLHIWSWSSTRVTRFLVTTLTKALLHQLLSFDATALARVLVVSNLFH